MTSKSPDDNNSSNFQSEQTVSPNFQQEYYVGDDIQQSSNAISETSVPRASKSELSIIPQPNSEKEVASVIVTICGDSSYDNIFRSIPQEAPDGRIAVYDLSPHAIEKLLNLMKSEKQDLDKEDLFAKLLADIRNVDPDSVLFNWECCSMWSNRSYNFYPDCTIEFMGYLLKRGHMVMCSDFAVKSLINNWKEEHLGPKIFKKLGECTSAIELRFNSTDLKNCPSAQLNVVGDLCPDGKACIHALSGTVVVGLDKVKADTKEFKVDILTVATNAGGFKTPTDDTCLWEISGQKGTVGHALVKYPNGGLLLISAGHWIELSNLNVNFSELKKVADSYGSKYNSQMDEISQMCETEQKVEIQKMAKQFIQQNSAAKYSKKINK